MNLPETPRGSPSSGCVSCIKRLNSHPNTCHLPKDVQGDCMTSYTEKAELEKIKIGATMHATFRLRRVWAL
jgi:hypothetical protein